MRVSWVSHEGHNVLLIADEIITGFCRTGRWFGLAHWSVKPDMLSFAKGVTSGYLPLGGMMVNRAITRARPAAGAHPAIGDSMLFAPPLVVTEAEIDRLVSVARDAAKVVLGV